MPGSTDIKLTNFQAACKSNGEDRIGSLLHSENPPVFLRQLQRRHWAVRNAPTADSFDDDQAGSRGEFSDTATREASLATLLQAVLKSDSQSDRPVKDGQEGTNWRLKEMEGDAVWLLG